MIQKNDPVARAIEILFSTGLAPCYLAYSGGMDSHVLLHALASYQKKHPALVLTVLHINHQLHPNADQWALQCQTVCEQWDLPCYVEQVTVTSRHGLEADARYARYQAFASHMKPESLLVTAHHQRDQAETFLLQALRGAGPNGLGGIRYRQPFAGGYLMRPFLSLSPAQLTDYAKQHQLQWLDDPSNAHVSLRRNFLRHHVLPLLTSQWPGAEKTLARSAALCADQHQVIASAITVCEQVSVKELLKQPTAQRNHWLRQWCLKKQLGLPTQQQLQQLNETVLKAKQAADPQLAWQAPGNKYRSIVRRYRDTLYGDFLKPCLIPHSPIPWHYETPLILDELGTLTAVLTKGKGIKAALLQDRTLYVTFRQGGERFFPSNRIGSHPLKKLFQIWGVPPWQRATTPLICLDEELIAVVGFCCAKGKETSPEEWGYCFTFSEKHD